MAETSRSIPIEIEVPQFINFQALQSSFMLEFPGFHQGLASNTESVGYFIAANHVMRDRSLVEVLLPSEIPGIRLEAKFDRYDNQIDGSSLIASSAGFSKISTRPVAMADKKKNKKKRKNQLYGNLWLQYRALASRDLEAGDRAAVLSVTFSDE